MDIDEFTLDNDEQESVEEQESSVEEENTETAGDVEEESNADESESSEADVEEESNADVEEESKTTEKAPAWVAEVRKKNREQQKVIGRLQKQLEEKLAEKPEPADIVVGEAPKLEDFNYEEEKFSKAYSEYAEKVQKANLQKQQKDVELQKQQAHWTEKRTKYAVQQKTHAFKDFNDSEDYVVSVLNNTQQNIILNGANDAALLVYYLGRSPDTLEALEKIKDPIDFAVKVGMLEARLSTKQKKKAPAPEKRVAGKKSTSVKSDTTLEKLRKEAEVTGEYTKLQAYKRTLKDK